MSLTHLTPTTLAPDILRVSSISKRFRLHHELGYSGHTSWFRYLQMRHQFEDLWILKNISFSVGRGATLGIIGQNGSGKSTLLKLITGVLAPTSGQIKVQGRVSALIELGAGFHHDLSGMDNIYLNGALLGLSHKEIKPRIPEIVAFAELERFIDTPLKYYSSGMQTRLAFAVAAIVKPDILITDEVLAVGDESFQRKCLAYMDAYRKQGGTILFVSHSLDQVSELCDRALWLSDGSIRADGKPDDVIAEYRADVYRRHPASAHLPDVIGYSAIDTNGSNGQSATPSSDSENLILSEATPNGKA
jgi:ABC-type polysaccharide/polyol phosphate transport system ATPase subunit